MKQLKRLGDRQLITLGQELRREGKGKIYQILETPSLAAKIYPPRERIPSTAEKLELMLADPPENDFNANNVSIAWPVDLLVSENNNQEIVGYLMPKRKDAIPIDRYYNPNLLKTKKYRNSSFESFNRDFYSPYRIGINLAAAFRSIHAKGYAIGDINESNILVTQSGSIVIVNTDSFQICNLATNEIYYCSTSNPEFAPPELQGKDLTKIHRTPQQDLFGLGILIFKLLMSGIHPYDGIFLSTDEAAMARAKPIRFGHFPYGNRKIPYYPPSEAPPFNYLHPRLQELFINCFEKGHSHPPIRPTAIAWEEALQLGEQELLTCQTNPQHKYSGHLDDCPWCANSPKYDLQEIAANDFPTADRGLPPSSSKKRDSPTYRRQKQQITNRSLETGSSSALPSSLIKKGDRKQSSKSWLNPRKKLKIWGVTLLSLLGLWVFIAITIAYPVQFIAGSSLIFALIWIIFKSKQSRK